jgi:hypothetical protein
MQLRFSAALVLAAAMLAAGCHGIIDPSQNKVDPFTGTIAPGGQGPAHAFSASRTGEIQVKVTALTPSSSNTFVGVLWTGRDSSGTCTGASRSVFAQYSFAQVNVPAISTQILSGSYCLTLYDVGSFTTTVTYTVTVSHPE